MKWPQENDSKNEKVATNIITVNMCIYNYYKSVRVWVYTTTTGYYNVILSNLQLNLMRGRDSASVIILSI